MKDLPETESDGVPALEGAGTPSSFRPAASESTLEALEFNDALALVAGWAAGPLGAAAVRARTPRSEEEGIRTELDRVGETLDLLARGEAFDVTPVPEIATALARLRIEGSVLDGPDLVRLRATLAAGREIAGQLRRVEPLAPRVAGLAVPIPDRRLERRLDESLDPEGELLDTASPALAAARREIVGARERLVRKLEQMLRSLDPQALPSGATVTVREGRYVIPVRRDLRARPAGIVHDESASAGTLFVEPTDAIELGNALREAIAAAAREAHRVLRELTAMLRPHHPELEAVHVMCVAADDLLARARYAHARGAAVPVVEPPGGTLVLRDARHPVLLERLPDTVPFDLELDPTERTVLVSGPNAGGKTVFLKAAGLAAALIQAGVVPPLRSGSRIPIFTRFFTDIGDHQSIAADLSTFSAHVATLRGILDQADAESLILLDELGSGTDPSEGSALAWAVLETLTRRRALTIATTHLGALKTLASQEPGVVNASLEFDTASLSPTYRFTKGTPGRSYGLAIARRLGVPSEVVERAEARMPAQERALDALLASVESRDRVLREREAELERREAQAAENERHLTDRESQASTREVELRRRERAAEREARARARSYLLDARRTVDAAIQRAEAGTEDAAREARRMVEQAVRTAADPDAAPEEVVGSAGPLEPGVRIRLASGGIGRVETVREDGRVTVLAGDVRIVVPREAVIARLPDADSRVRPGPPAPDVDARTAAAPMEIDLRGMRADEAETVVLSAIDAAILADHPFLRIIHGRGTGAVRDRVHQVVKSDRRVSRYALAPATQGGAGVTLVEFGR